MKLTIKNSSFLVHSFVILLIEIWQPVNTILFHIDGAGRIPLILLILSLLLTINAIIHISLHKPLIIYLVLAIYMFVNGMIKGGWEHYESYESSGVYLLFFRIFMAPFYMFLVAKMAFYDFNKTLKVVTWGFLLYCIICLLGAGESHAHEGRLGEAINANEIGLVAAILFIVVLLQYIRGSFSLFYFIAFSAISLFTIFETGSRMAISMVIIVAVLVLLFTQKNYKLHSLFYMIVSLLIGYFVIRYIMDNTLLGARFQTTSQEMEFSELATGTFLDKFGDRGLQYYYSWPFFTRNILTGIGFDNWADYNPIGSYRFHSEYLVQYCECGLIGISLYLYFLISLFHRLLKVWFSQTGYFRKTLKVLFFGLLAIAVANFVIWTHNSVAVFAIFALSYAASYKVQQIQAPSC